MPACRRGTLSLRAIDEHHVVAGDVHASIGDGRHGEYRSGAVIRAKQQMVDVAGIVGVQPAIAAQVTL